jgi:hypothetical protein
MRLSGKSKFLIKTPVGAACSSEIVEGWFRFAQSTLTLQNFFIVGWALPTKNNPIQLLTVGNAHPTGILLESTNGKFQKHRRISVHAYTYAVGETNSA